LEYQDNKVASLILLKRTTASCYSNDKGFKKTHTLKDFLKNTL